MLDFDINLDLNDVQTTSTKEDEGKPTRVLLRRIEGTEADFYLELDNTALERFTTCARSAQYYLVNHRELAVVKPALKFGSAIHKALEVQLCFGNSPASVSRQAEVALQHFMQAGPNPPEDFRTPDRAIQVMDKYRKKFPTEHFTLLEINGEPAVEIKFTVPLGVIEVNDFLHYPAGSKTFVGKLHLVWTGKIDALVEQDGWTWVLDHKTTSIIGKTYFLDFVLNNAQQGYVWAARKLLNKPVRGSILNAIINRPPTPTGKSIDFQRQQFIYSDDQIEEWHDNTLALVGDFVHNLRRGYFPRQTKWCVGKYGVCGYHDVCSLDRAQRAEQLASSQFKNVVWNPLDNE